MGTIQGNAVTIFESSQLSRLITPCLLFCRMNTIRLWQPQLFTILDNYNSLNYNATAGQELSFCEILDTSTVAGGVSAVVENSTCVNVRHVNSQTTIGSFSFLIETNFVHISACRQWRGLFEHYDRIRLWMYVPTDG